MVNRKAKRNSSQNEFANVSLIQSPPHGYGNPYIDILRTSLQKAGLEVGSFRTFRDSPRVILLHWTENYWFGNHASATRRSLRFIKRKALLFALKTLRARGSTVVWFAHNTLPHGWPGSQESWNHQAREFFQQLDVVVHLTKASASLPEFDHLLNLAHTVVRHPHDSRVDPALHARQAGGIQRVLLLGGASQPRKNAYSAAQAIQGVPELRAVITGDLESDFASAFTSYPKVDLLDGFLCEKSLFSLFDGATAVLLNQVNQLNSGVMYLGLSRGAPVICPDTPSNREIRSIVGSDWIRLFEHPLSSEKLAEHTRKRIPAELPDLTAFDPDTIAVNFREWLENYVDDENRRTR